MSQIYFSQPLQAPPAASFPLTPVFNANTLKILAIALMFFDHFSAVFFPHNSLWGMATRVPGRIVAPLMCYFVAEGYYYTAHRAKYIQRMFIFALISHIPYILCFNLGFFQATSVMWGLTMGLVALTAVKNQHLPLWLRLGAVPLCCVLSVTANWNYVAVLWIVAFGVLRGNYIGQMLSFMGIGIVFHILPTYLNFGLDHSGYPHWYQLGIFLAIPLLLLYTGKLGKKSKVVSYLFYIFYPAHLLLIYILNNYTTLNTLWR